MSLDHSRELLEINHELLQEIEMLYRDYIHLKEAPVKLTVKVKNFLENARSPLDYAANYLFDTYCTKHIKDPNKIPSRKRKVVFPIDDSEGIFQKSLKEKLDGLQHERPDVVSIIEKSQPFNSNLWIKRLRDLANSNKHVELTKQERKILSRHIQIGGLSLIDCDFKDNGTDIMIDDTPINVDLETQLPMQSHPLMNTTALVDFYFKGRSEPVIPLLRQIYNGVSQIITELEEIL